MHWITSGNHHHGRRSSVNAKIKRQSLNNHLPTLSSTHLYRTTGMVHRARYLPQFRVPNGHRYRVIFFIVEQFLTGLCREPKFGFDDRIHRARLLAVTAIDALRHVDIVSRCPATAVLARLSLDRNRKRRANGLAQFTSDATLFSIRIASQDMLPTEPRRQCPFS